MPRSGGRAFFFFFFGFTSPDFESAPFRRFCEVCYRVRSFKPSLTLSTLHAFLSVAAEDGPVTYDRLAHLCGGDYRKAAISAAVLSDGRGTQPGMKLLRRVQGRDKRAKVLVLSRTGRAVADLFGSVSGNEAPTAGTLRDNVLPALKVALQSAPDINLSAFAIFLYIAQNNARFAYHGDPAVTIAQALHITNLPRNLVRLSTEEGIGLIELKSSPHDRRLRLPALSRAGLTLVANIAAVLQGTRPSPVLQPKPESLTRATSPDDVRRFTDEDFDAIDVDVFDWGEDDSPDPN
jgi:DNA-binding MarR family transcriptional regulator